MKAVFLDYATMGPGLDLEPLNRFFDAFDVYQQTADDEVGDRIHDADFVFTNKFRMVPAVLERAGNLRLIGLTATGTDNVDLDEARRRGIAVCNIRAYCTGSVVEHVFGVMLMLSHSLGPYADAVNAGEWQRAQDFCMLNHPVPGIAGKTLGIVGYGELGRGVERVGRAFGMDILVSARPGSSGVPAGRVPFDEVLTRADVVTLHCPLTEETTGLMGAGEFRRMRSGALLINTARGALVDSEALVAALEGGEIAGAAIDVLPKEPPVDGDPLLDYRGANLIVTPHIAWATDAARQNAIDELAANVEAFLAGERRNRVD
jgi:glycerate dehydrogenase